MPVSKKVQIKIKKSSEKAGIICVKSFGSRVFPSTKPLK